MINDGDDGRPNDPPPARKRACFSLVLAGNYLAGKMDFVISASPRVERDDGG